MQNSVQNFNKVANYLNTFYYEREETVQMLLTALISKSHCLLIGKPGTGKTELVDELLSSITNSNQYLWQLSKYTTPDELFGPVLMSEYEKGTYKRNTYAKMPWCNVARLDEIFKATVVLSTLLQILQSRRFDNNGMPEPCPLWTCFGMSNEYTEEDELDALDDRFLLRQEVDYIQDDNNFLQLLQNDLDVSLRPVLDVKDIISLQQAAELCTVDASVLESIQKIKADLNKEGIIVSDRRYKASVKIAKANATLQGCTAVDFTHLSMLKHVLWRKPEEKKLVQAIVTRYCVDSFSEKLNSYKQQVQDIYNNAMKDKTTEAGTEANKKVKFILQELDKIKAEQPARAASVDAVIAKIKQKNSEILTACLGL